MGFFTPINFLFLFGAIPIIIMYLLKKKHQDVEISSIYLWQRALKDIEANAPWQRLKKNILLILQLLTFAMLVFFLAKPFLNSYTFNADDLIVILDKSLSMSALEDNESRFDKAKNEIEKLFKSLKSGTSVTFITMGNSPEIIASNTEDKSFLINELNKVSLSNEADNPNDTLSLVKAVTKNKDSYRVVFFTDKIIDINMDNIIIRKIGSPQNNIAIENISCKRINGSLGAAINIVNYGNASGKGDLIVYAGNEIFDVQEITIEPNESKEVYIHGIPNTNIVKAEIDIQDALRDDNIRYGVVNGSNIKKVLLITTGNIFLEKAIALNENIELYKTSEVLPDVKGYDLYIYDGRIPSSIPMDGNIFIINPSNLEGIIKVKELIKEGNLSIIDDELLQYVDLDISMSRVKTLLPPEWAKTFIYSNGQTVAFKGIKENQKFVVLGFDLHDTDFPLKYSFPIFIQNVLDYTLNLNTQKNTSVLCGEGIEIDASPRSEEIFIKYPNGDIRKIAPPFPVSIFTDTNEAGIYTIEQKTDKDNETIFNYFSANVDTIVESNISQLFEEDNEIITRNEVTKNAMINIKNIFLILALIFLAVEWVVYNRGY